MLVLGIQVLVRMAVLLITLFKVAVLVEQVGRIDGGMGEVMCFRVLVDMMLGRLQFQHLLVVIMLQQQLFLIILVTMLRHVHPEQTYRVNAPALTLLHG